MEFIEVIQKIKKSEHIVIAIDGPSGSLKSTFASWLKEHYSCTVFHCDDYFLPENRKTKERLEEAGGNVDYERMEEEIFSHLQDNTIQSNRYNCQIGVLEETKPVAVNNVIIIEGVYSMHPRFLPYYDITIFLTVDREEQLQRILLRSNEKMLNRFKTEWIPLENLYFNTYDIRNKANLVVDTTMNFRELLTASML